MYYSSRALPITYTTLSYTNSTSWSKHWLTISGFTLHHRFYFPRFAIHRQTMKFIIKIVKYCCLESRSNRAVYRINSVKARRLISLSRSQRTDATLLHFMTQANSHRLSLRRTRHSSLRIYTHTYTAHRNVPNSVSSVNRLRWINVRNSPFSISPPEEEEKRTILPSRRHPGYP